MRFSSIITLFTIIVIPVFAFSDTNTNTRRGFVCTTRTRALSSSTNGQRTLSARSLAIAMLDELQARPESITAITGVLDRRGVVDAATLRDPAKREALEKRLLNRFVGLTVQRDDLKQKKDNEGVERVQREIDRVKKDLEAINQVKKDEAAYIPAYEQFMAGGGM